MALSEQVVTSSVTNSGSAFSAAGGVPRGLVVLAWASGIAGLYALLGVLHAALVERSLSVEVGFGRALAYWVGTAYLGLLLWGFLPREAAGWYARRSLMLGAAAFGVLGLLVCGGFTVAWVLARWSASAGPPAVASLIGLLVVALGVLWLAGREDRARSTPPGA